MGDVQWLPGYCVLLTDDPDVTRLSELPRPGANVKAVQRMLGHASAAMTLDVYAGLFDDDLDGLADRMDEAHVYSMCTEAKDDAKSKKTNVTQFHSATTELG